MVKSIRNFGVVRAILDQDTNTATLTIPRRYGDQAQQFEDETIASIVENWAKPWLVRMGYEVST